MEEREKDKYLAATAKSKVDRVCTNEGRSGAASGRPRAVQKSKVCYEFNIFYYQQVFAEVTIVVPDSPRPGEASGGSDCGCTPSTPAFEPAGA